MSKSIAVKKKHTPISLDAIKFVEGPNYYSFYCNNTGFNVSVVDFVMYLGEILEVGDGRATVERRARVTMSPIQAKAMAVLLNHNIKAYELQNGPIRDSIDIPALELKLNEGK